MKYLVKIKERVGFTTTFWIEKLCMLKKNMNHISIKTTQKKFNNEHLKKIK